MEPLLQTLPAHLLCQMSVVVTLRASGLPQGIPQGPKALSEVRASE
jgi:hypothetical protein